MHKDSTVPAFSIHPDTGAATHPSNTTYMWMNVEQNTRQGVECVLISSPFPKNIKAKNRNKHTQNLQRTLLERNIKWKQSYTFMKVVNCFLHQFSQQHSQAYKYWAMDTILIFLALYATAMAHVQPAYCESNQRGLTDKSMTWPESDWAKKLKGKMPPKTSRSLCHRGWNPTSADAAVRCKRYPTKF